MVLPRCVAGASQTDVVSHKLSYKKTTTAFILCKKYDFDDLLHLAMLDKRMGDISCETVVNQNDLENLKTCFRCLVC